MNEEAGNILAVLRRLERDEMDFPRVGRSSRLRDDFVEIGQDPRLAFPSREVERTEPRHANRHRLRAQFMGFFGPNGALPLNLTEEVLRWNEDGEDGFVQFVDILAARFYQLFFRAWSDAHAISQHDRPDADRFAQYIAAVAGTGSPAYREHDGFPDIARLPLVSLFGGRVRSAVRLRQMVSSYFRLDVEIDEHVPTWLEFEPDEMHGLGSGGSLGRDMYLGTRLKSINEKICIHLHIPDVETYRSFLPGQERHQRLSDLVYWYIGRTYEVELALTLPPSEIPPARIGETVSLGWLAALTPSAEMRAHKRIEISRFALSHGA